MILIIVAVPKLTGNEGLRAGVGAHYRGVNQCKNLASLAWKESLESYQIIRNLIESDKNLRNLIRIFRTPENPKKIFWESLESLRIFLAS